MPITETFQLGRASHRVVYLILGCALLTIAAQSQIAQIPPVQPSAAIERDNLATSIDEVKRDNWASVDTIVKEAGSEKAIPILKDLFAQSKDVDTKAWIASALVKLGDRDETYWRFVVEQTREVIESDVPFPVTIGAEGKEAQGKLAPEFTAWAKAHNLSPEETAKAAYNSVYPIKMGLLANTGDPRAIPILRRGLLARDFMVEAASATGLVMLKDRDSIPLILEACKRAPVEMAGAIAMSLLEFHDPEAQNAAEPYLPKQLVDALHEKKQ
jgi:HEAT repeat protein